jgi:septum site-determining protein MinC
MPPNVQIKGIREGLLVTVGDGDWPEVQKELLAHLEPQVEFLRGAKLILDVGGQELNAATLGKLRDQISEQQISLWAVLSTSPLTEQTAQTLGLATRIHQTPATQAVRTLDTNISGDEAILVKRTLRSGNSLEHTGHITIIGDVNPGAEIVAGGSVVVWGRLRGMVHAGANGNNKAIVCALDLSPTQLRIADKIAILPKQAGDPHPCIASMKDGQVMTEEWNLPWV